MSWLPIIGVAAVAFAIAAIALKLPRAQWMLFGAALLFGLAGYGAQGSPSSPSAPTKAAVHSGQTGELLVEARREFYADSGLPSRFVVTADAFARRGQFDQSANFLRNAVVENPNDGEAWLALALALVEHAEGRLTPGALHAFRRAEEVRPGNPAPGYFLGLSMLREGRPQEARNLWAQLLADAPQDAKWRPALQLRLDRLDQLLLSPALQSPPGFAQ